MDDSAEVVVAATIRVKPDAVDEAMAAFTAAIEDTHAEEGCIAYALHRDRDDPTRFVVIERWASTQALDEHLASDHIRTLFGAIGGLVADPPEIIRTVAVPLGDAGKGTL